MAATDGQTQYFTHSLRLSAQSEPALTEVPLTIAYRTHGSPLNPAVLLPTCYGGKLDGITTWLYSGSGSTSATSSDSAAAAAAAAAEPVLSPDKYFIILTALFGGGESSSPSNTPAPYDGPRFPRVTYEDNIRLQHALCTQRLRVSRLHAYVGFSMGGQQAYHMAALYPAFVERIVCLAGSARTSWHNWCFLEGPKAALLHSADFCDGEYKAPARRGVLALGRSYAAWVLGREWFRRRLWQQLGHDSLESWLRAEWDDDLASWDANDLLCLLWTWQKGDLTLYSNDGDKTIAADTTTTTTTEEGQLASALARIEAHVLLMPCRTDAYFPPEDNEEELKHLKRGKLSVIESIWGHFAGGGASTQQDMDFIASEIDKFFRETS